MIRAAYTRLWGFRTRHPNRLNQLYQTSLGRMPFKGDPISSSTANRCCQIELGRVPLAWRLWSLFHCLLWNALRRFQPNRESSIIQIGSLITFVFISMP